MTTQRAPHLLYVAWGYPPGRGGGSYRSLATPNAFARAGWKVTVLTGLRETFRYTTGIDERLEKRIDPSITVERIPFRAVPYEVDLRRWGWLRARFPEFHNAWRGFRDRRAFPERVYGGWRGPLEAAARRIHRTSPVSLTIASANPYVDFTAAAALHADAGVPYVLDYRDAWQLDVFSGERSTPANGDVARWESRLMADAHEIWFVNEPIRAWHAELHPQQADRMRVVANGYDAELVSFSDRVDPGRGDGLTFGYIGTMSPKVPLRELMAGWRLARERDELMARSTLVLHGDLGYAGKANDEWLALLREYSAHGVEYRGPVSKIDLTATYDRFDALVLALGTGAYVTSGKVYEYCASGLPIASVHDPGNAASDVLRGYPAWSSAESLETEHVADALMRCAAMSARQTTHQRADAQGWAAKYERQAQLTPRITELHAAVSGGQS